MPSSETAHRKALTAAHCCGSRLEALKVSNMTTPAYDKADQLEKIQAGLLDGE